jgi:DegV family protein with EDD domain
VHPGTIVVPLRIVFGDEVLRDGIDITPEQFYARLAAGERPTTSTPSPGEYLEAFRAAGAAHVVCLTIPDQLSTMYSAARVAADLEAEEAAGSGPTVTVVDTRTVAAGLGLVASVAARACATGVQPEAVLDIVHRAMETVRVFGTLSTLTYLARSGRVPSITATMTGVLDIHPVFELREGEVARLGLPRTWRRTLETLSSVAVDAFDGQRVRLVVFHSAVPDRACELQSLLSSSLDVAERSITALTPTLGAYTGPGMVGFAALPEAWARLAPRRNGSDGG